MNVTFKSVITHEDNDPQVVQFVAKVNVVKRQEFLTWEFREPTNNIMNLVEATTDQVNIFAGSQTIVLKLKERTPCEYFQEGMPAPIYFNSFLDEVSIENNNIEIKYSLWNDKVNIGNYNLKLTVNE